MATMMGDEERDEHPIGIHQLGKLFRERNPAPTSRLRPAAPRREPRRPKPLQPNQIRFAARLAVEQFPLRLARSRNFPDPPGLGFRYPPKSDIPAHGSLRFR